jgi:tRNA threonylcarbamoyladenosine biosynthesis protein TsaE
MLKYLNLDEEAVTDLAQKLARELTQKKAIIGLTGNLGAGKTTFVKAFARELKIKSIKSPTFVVTHQYKHGQGALYHLDFYRLKDHKQLTDLGLDEILSGPNLVLMEWVEKFPQIKKQCDILINFKFKPNNKRDVTIQAQK